MPDSVTLADLNKRGRTTTITDRNDPSKTVTVWTQKMSVGEQDEAFRRARAAGAVAMSRTRDQDSDDFQIFLSDAYELGDRADAITFLVNSQLRKDRVIDKVEAEVGSYDEWEEEKYLEGLRDAWQGGLNDRWKSDPTDPEAARVFTEMQRFLAQVTEELDRRREDLRSDWEDLDDDSVYRKAAERLAESDADQQFNKEYMRCEMWQGTRRHDPAIPDDQPHPEHANRYFTARAEVNDLDEVTILELQASFAMLLIPEIAGKDLPPGQASSTSSEPAEKAATPESSGLVGASA